MAAANDLAFDSDFEYEFSDSESSNGPTLPLTNVVNINQAELCNNHEVIDNNSSSDTDSSDSESEEATNDVNEQTFDVGEELRFVFDTLEQEVVPSFEDWQTTEKVFCIPPFIPTANPGATTVYPQDMKPIEFFNLYYDDNLIQKVSKSGLSLETIMCFM